MPAADGAYDGPFGEKRNSSTEDDGATTKGLLYAAQLTRWLRKPCEHFGAPAAHCGICPDESNLSAPLVQGAARVRAEGCGAARKVSRRQRSARPRQLRQHMRRRLCGRGRVLTGDQQSILHHMGLPVVSALEAAAETLEFVLDEERHHIG